MKQEENALCRVAVLDDNLEEGLRQKTITEQYFGTNNEWNLDIKVFQDSKLLMEELKAAEYYDIFLLDYELPDKSGLAVANEIRRYYDEPVFIFVTNYVQYAVQAFEVNAFRYIPKKLLEEKLPEAYKAILPKVAQKDKRIIRVNTVESFDVIYLKDIFYIRKEGKYSIMHHRRGEIRIQKAISAVLKDLEVMGGSEFMLSDKGCIVNVTYIISCSRERLVMADDTALPVSRSKYKKIREQAEAMIEAKCNIIRRKVREGKR